MDTHQQPEGKPRALRGGDALRTPGSLALALVLSASAPSAARSQADVPAGPPDRRVPVRAPLDVAALGRQPLRFDANRGQTDSKVRFFSRGPGFTLFLTARESVLSLMPAAGTSARRPAVVRMAWKGADPNAPVTGREELPGKSSYLVGNDPSKWIADAASFGRVEYRNLYPGIDLAFYGTGRQPEYDFILAPGVDPSVIRLSFTGEDSLEIDEAGALVLRVGDETVVHHAPVIYQEISGERRRLGGSWVKAGPHEAGFRVRGRDAGHPLTIDPVLSFSTFLGGAGFDHARGVALDAQKNVYVTGYTNSLTFPGPGGATRTNNDAFVTKISASGGHVYSTFLGGSSDDFAYAIAVNGAGEAHVTGRTNSTDFPLANAYQATRVGADSAFFTKLNAAGNAALYSSYLGGTSGTNIGYGIALDGAGRAYVAGGTASNNFPIAGTPFQATFGGIYDAFVAKFDPSLSGGPSLVYSTYVGWTSWEYAYAIAVDGGGNAYIAGETSSFTASREVLVAKLDATGSALDYGVYFGGTGDEYGYGIAIDGGGNAYVTGRTASSNFPTTAGAFQTTAGGALDAFVSKLDPTGANLPYSTYLGGGSDDTGWAIAVDAAGNAFVTGETSTNFPVQNPLPYTGSYSNRDAFVTEVNPGGTGLVFSTRLGGSGTVSGDKGYAVALDGVGGLYVAGQTDSTNFPTLLPIQATHGDGGTKSDAFVLKISTSSVPGFFSVVPCRLFDTRESAGPSAAAPVLGAGEARTIAVAGRCGIPGSARALSVNVTETGAAAPGNFVLYRADLPGPPNTNNLSFGAGQTRANNGLLQLDLGGGGTFKVFNNSSAPAHFILDVNGYFQ